MKRITITILLLTMIATAALAAPRPGAPQGPGHGAKLAEFLDLSDTQIASTQALRETLRATVEPLHDSQKANREQIEAALQAGDSAKAGTLMLANYQLAQQIKAARDAFKSGFEALLNADQKAKLAILEELREARHERGPRG
ncbi:MAG TPA: Spy/CpxP family protein refolding chaperone [Thermoanaerobaculia bacterium]|nr:Spy/CpxP family protein refolding chaperone [Thermoanaerobaculia bacterium]